VGITASSYLDGGDLLVDLHLLVAGACVEWRLEKEAGRGATGRRRRREERKKKGCVKKKEKDNFLLIFEFVEELQCSANLLNTVASHHFVEQVVEPDGEGF
jgi:hypothetical protein